MIAESLEKEVRSMPYEPQEGGLLGSFLGFALGGIIGANWKKLKEAVNSFMEALKKK